jgi:acylphosphatase
LRGLEGWVRNRRDGTVETVLAGDPEAVEAMLAALREGPRGARVDAVETSEAGPDALARGAASGFAVLPTA